MVKTDPSKTVIGTGNGHSKVKAVYVGRGGKTVKVWDKEQGVIDREGFEAAMKAVSEHG